MECLFCPNDVDGSDEHVILNAIGGRKSSKMLACRRCNNLLGATIDKQLLDAIDFMTLIIAPPTRRRSNGATKRILDANGVKYEMVEGGRLRIRYEQIAPNQWIADASDAGRVQDNIRRAAEALEARTGMPATITTVNGTQVPAPIMFGVQLDNFTALRATLKWAVELLGMHVLNTQESRHGTLRAEREFVATGSAPPLAGYLERTLVPEMFEGLEHYVLAVQSPDGSVYWEASAYGGAIATAGRTGTIESRFEPIMYRIDPVTGEHATESPRVSAPNDRCWWVPEYQEICRQRTLIAGQRMEQLMNRRHAIDDIVRECMEQCWPAEGIITEQHTAALSRCIAERYVRLTHTTEGVAN